jgi:acetolactate synthase I/II/III large subunit
MNIAPKLARTRQIKGGSIVSRILAAEGVQRAFGITDGTYLGMISTFRENEIQLITPRHEANALHMAGAYARLTGRLGVAIASNGPGVANALPGVAVEQAEGNRVLLITTCRRHGIVYPERGGTYQYFPQTKVIGAMAKWSVAVPSVDRLAELMRRALRHCYTGRPGVVHIDVPESVMNAVVDEDATWFRSPDQYRLTEPLTPSFGQIRTALSMLRVAKRPLIHAGSGVLHAGASNALLRFAERHRIPITTSWAARGVVDERHELALSMKYVAPLKQARNDADLVIVLGSRLGESDFWGKAPRWAQPGDQKLLQVDLDLEHLGNNRPVDLAVQADVGAFLDLMLSESPNPLGGLELRRAWMKTLSKGVAAQDKKLSKHLKTNSVPMHTAHIPTTVGEVLEDDAVLVIDGGNTAVWTHFYSQIKEPGAVLATAKMGMLGAGIPQALGAKVAFPDRQVVCLIGDGAMGFHPQEIETAVREDLPVVFLVVCDRQWGMVKINQSFALRPIKTLVKKRLEPEETVNTELGEVEWDQLARSMGAHGERVADAAGLEGAIRRSLASGKPAVIHVDVDPVAHLWAPELKTFVEMHQEPAGA